MLAHVSRYFIYLFTHLLLVIYSFICIHVCVKDPNVTWVSPSYGPKDGGTLITLTGTQLHTGLTQQVLVNNLICHINRSVNNLTFS